MAMRQVQLVDVSVLNMVSHGWTLDNYRRRRLKQRRWYFASCGS